MSEAHEEPVAVVLCRAVDMWPTVTEDKDEFLDKAISKFDSLTEVQYNQVPQALRQWAENAITAKLNGNPFGECPGFDDVFDVEDRTPLFANGPESEDEVEVTTKDKKGRKKVTRGVKAGKEKKDKTSTARSSRPMSDGKTSQIMDEIFANPKISVEQIRENLGKRGVATQKTSTTVVRSFYRHACKHLASKGALKQPLEF